MIKSELSEPIQNRDLQIELDFLFGRINYERSLQSAYPRHFKLESMRRLLDALGNPQERLPIVHVAGTKGKGSVCRLIAGALNESGITTGVYSSPHIESIRERISLGGEPISEEDLAKTLQIVRAAVCELDGHTDRNRFRPNSFFEIMNAAALLYFESRNADKVVLEVGLGGRLDSTNVCHPELCVITNISLDHTRQLGATVDLIAREKAGIIKPQVPVVSGVTDPLASGEVHEACSVCNSDLVELDRDFHCQVLPNSSDAHFTRFHTWGLLHEHHRYRMDDLEIQSAGEFQARNASLAVAALNLLPDRDRISHTAIRRSFREFHLIGRGEVLSRSPLIVVDMAHNLASIDALVQMLAKLHPPTSAGRRRLVFASSRDKDVPGMLARLLPCFDEIILTQFLENPRAVDPDELQSLARSIADSGKTAKTLLACQSPREAWATLSPILRKPDSLCIAGSAFLVAELRPLVRQFLSHQEPAC